MPNSTGRSLVLFLAIFGREYYFRDCSMIDKCMDCSQILKLKSQNRQRIVFFQFCIQLHFQMVLCSRNRTKLVCARRRNATTNGYDASQCKLKRKILWNNAIVGMRHQYIDASIRNSLSRSFIDRITQRKMFGRHVVARDNQINVRK